MFIMHLAEQPLVGTNNIPVQRGNMTKARDLANLISGGFTEADIPNLSASKITSGSFADARIPNLNAITTLHHLTIINLLMIFLQLQMLK